jgi:hypothetical protein
MVRGFVGRRGIGVAINLHQHEAGEIVRLLHEIKACDSRLEHTGAGVGERGGFEGIEVFRLNVNVNMDDEHGSEM